MSFHQPLNLRRISPCLVLLLCLVLLSSCGNSAVVIVPGGQADDGQRGTLLDPPKELANFTLTDQTGASLSLDDLRGRPSLVFFGFTNCPDVCPLTMSEWTKVKQSLGESAKDVAFVFISVDPERDTPEVIDRYLDKYDSSFIGLTGDMATIEATAKDFGIHFQAKQNEGDGGPLVEHSSYSFLLDRDARMHMIYSYNMPTETVVGDIRALLAQGGS